MEGASLLRAGGNILIEVVRQLLPFYDCKAKKKPSIYLLAIAQPSLSLNSSQTSSQTIILRPSGSCRILAAMLFLMRRKYPDRVMDDDELDAVAAL
jgi:hypothetical protein